MPTFYYGTKLIKAEPMTRLAYNLFRGWTLPSDENADDEGYLVEYHDGGAGNVPSHVGYVSWSPKAVFEKSYFPSGSLNFGHALEALKIGLKVCRLGNYDRFLQYIPNGGPLEECILVSLGANKVQVNWSPSLEELLANDWCVLDFEKL